MKNSAVRYVLALVTLVLGAAGEELLPKALGTVGFPFLLAATGYFAARCPLVLMALFAVAAGRAEDVLSALPLFTSVSFFLLLAVLVRLTRLPYVIAPFAYPAYQLWLCLWCVNLNGSVYTRVLLAFPFGLVTVAVLTAVLLRVERKAAADEEG